MRKLLAAMSGVLIFAVLFNIVVFTTAQEVTETPPEPIDLMNPVTNLEGYNIYFSEPNGEVSRFDRNPTGISRYAGLLSRAGANLFTLEWRKGFPTDADLIVITAAEADLSADQVARLWAYLSSGGRVLLAVDPVGSRGISRALPSASGFFELSWNDLGIRARDDVMVLPGELQSVTFMERQRVGDQNVDVERTEDAPILETDFVTDAFETSHPITAALEGSLFYSTARSVEYDGSAQDFRVVPLIYDGVEDSYGEAGFADYLTTGYSQYNVGTDTGTGRTAIAAAYDDPRSGGRMVVLGDVDILRNGTGFETSPPYSPSFVYPTNVQFMMNTTAWLLDAETASLSFPAPEPTGTPTSTPTPVPTATPGSE